MQVSFVPTHTPSTRAQVHSSDFPGSIGNGDLLLFELTAMISNGCDISFKTNKVARWYFAQLLCSTSAASKPLRERLWSYGFLSLAPLGKSWMVAASNAVFGHKVSVFRPYCPRIPQTSPFWCAGVVAPYRGNCALSVFQQSGRRRVARYVCRNDDIF